MCEKQVKFDDVNIYGTAFRDNRDIGVAHSIFIVWRTNSKIQEKQRCEKWIKR